MRILHLAKHAHPAPGGMETFVRDLSTEQVRQGHEVSVFCLRRALRPAGTDHAHGAAVTRFAALPFPPFAPLSPGLALGLRSAIRRLRPSVIHLHLPNPAALYAALPPRRVPLVVHWHADVRGSSSRTVRALYPAYRPFEQRCLARAERIVATSPDYLESSPSLAPWRKKCVAVPLGLDAARYPEEQTPEPDRPLVLAVGRLAFYKGFEHLVRAAALVPEADFVIAGDGPRRRALEREKHRPGSAGRVTLPGAISDAELRRHLQQASVFCLPSVDRGEAFGVTLLEAMRYGLPLVTTAVPGSGTAWVNRHGETGLVVSPKDPEGLATAIRRLLDDPEQARRYGEAGRMRLEDRFLITGVAREIEAVYRAAGAR